MVKITKKRFLEIFAVGTKWWLAKTWLKRPCERTPFFHRTVASHRPTKVHTIRTSDGQSSSFHLSNVQPPNEYWYDEVTGALEIRNLNEGHDKDVLPYLTLRYEPDAGVA